MQGVDFEVAPGEVVALVGQSGSGKTTVSRIVLGLEEPTSGQIWLDGTRWDGLSEAERRRQRVRFQYVPQDAMGASVSEQTKNVLERIDRLLGEAGSDKSRLLTATIWLSDIADFAEMNSVWDAWVVPGNTPCRACVQSALASPDFNVEIMVTAAVD